MGSSTGRLAAELRVHIGKVQRWHSEDVIRPAWATTDGQPRWEVEDVRRQLDEVHPERPPAQRRRAEGGAGAVLLRVSKELPPATAEQYRAALDSALQS